MSQEAVQKLVERIGANQMAMNFQIKIAVSIVIFRTEIDSGSMLQTTAKKKTTTFHERKARCRHFCQSWTRS